MAKQVSITIATAIENPELIKAYILQTFEQLKWKVTHIVDDKIYGYTPKSWSSWGESIACIINENQIEIISALDQNAIWDLFKKNNKNTKKFENVFLQNVSNGISESKIGTLNNTITDLQKQTQSEIETYEKEVLEVEQVMQFSKSNLLVTISLIAINCLVFILMAINGAGVFDANGLVHLQWGSNYKTLTASGDWWRLITNMFLHFGVMHLLVNMYSLYIVGVFLEPLLGKIKYIVIYFCTGIIASIVSLWWHSNPVNSAGASGAIFGLYGLFFALLVFKIVPKLIRESMIKSIGIFIIFNLVYGLKGGIDNAAHIGGLLSGFIFGLVYAKFNTQKKEYLKYWAVLVAVCTIIVSVGYFINNKVDKKERKQLLLEINAEKAKDYKLFQTALSKFDTLHQEAHNLLQFDSNATNAQVLVIVSQQLKPLWIKADSIIDGCNQMQLTDYSKMKIRNLKKFVSYKHEELNIINNYLLSNNEEAQIIKLKINRQTADSIFKNLETIE
jgi:rhomboid protease GluP